MVALDYVNADDPDAVDNSNADNGPTKKQIRTQSEMCGHFIPILREKGISVHKTGRRLARRAKEGEEVLTIINGEIIAKTTAEEGSMVVRQESADHELYVLSAAKFALNYVTPGVKVADTDAHAKDLRERGFQYYQRQGQLLIYQVTEADMAFVPEGEFQVSFSSIPQPLRAGDYLVTVCPEMQEVYMTRHSAIYNDDGQLMRRPGIRTQEEMCRHFIPILKERGTRVRKMGRRLARPAQRNEEVLTIINGEVVARTVITDDESMVIRQESVDRELYALSAEKFQRNYALPGIEIDDSDPNLDELRDRGFKYYERTGELLIYQVTEEDMMFVPDGKFQVSFSTIPQPLRVGDYLVTVLPDHKEVYMSRHATIYNDDGRLFQARGVTSQEDMKARFLQLMREKGTVMRRAGRRLARPAKKGEEVLTIVDTEVVCKTVVLDDSSMVVQEESADRELYVLDRAQFERSYETVGTEILDRGAEGEALRRRNFKYYEKLPGMVLIYRVTEEDLSLVPHRKFQVPFSITPQPLRAGDYLVTRRPEEDAIYLSRNAEQIYFSKENLEVHYVFASPLDHSALCVHAELEGLRTSGAVVRLTCATRVNLVLLKKAWSGMTPAVLHISCHTSVADASEQAEIVLEDANGAGFRVQASQFLDLLIGGGPAPEVAVISSCRSQSIAAACLQRGVSRVVAVRHTETLLDRAARDFAFSFYGELRAHRSVETAFQVALESMRASREPGVPAEASKLVLLPEGGSELNLGLGACLVRRATVTESMRCGSFALDLEPHLAVRVPFGAGEAGHLGPLVQPRGAVPRSVISAVAASEEMVPHSRRKFITSMLEAFGKFRVVKIKGPQKIGKGHLSGVLAGFAALPGGRFFSGGVAVISRGSDGGAMSQERMCDHFIPILKSKGTLVRKGGMRLARPAKLGEEVLTVINGEVVAKVVVLDETSMVIMQESSDHELYVLDQHKFEANYETPGKEILNRGHAEDVLAERGFKSYERKGQVLIYRVTEEDMKAVPGGAFEVSFSTIPQPLKVGDYIVTGYPDAKEVYMSRNAEQIYSSQIVRSHEETCLHFLPLIARKGLAMRRNGAWLARCAQLDEEVSTIINGDVVAKVRVTDESSMVVRAESCDGEYYVFGASDFSKYFESCGSMVADDGREMDTWRARGFQRYHRKGVVRVYKVTESDMKFFPSGRFWGKSPSLMPQVLRIGDHLVADQMDPDEVYACRNAEQVFEPVPRAELVRTQAEMRDHFIPLLRERGTRMRKVGQYVARPARRGELVQTLVDGELVAKAVAEDDSSMVVRRETVDRELMLLSRECFVRNFTKASSSSVLGDGPQFDMLRNRSFKYYDRHGSVLVLQVTPEDAEFVAGGQFQVPFSSIPQPLRVGDYLVTNLPACKRVFLNRNALQCYEPMGDSRRHGRSETAIPLALSTIPRMPSRSDSDSSFVLRLRSCVERGRPGPTPRRSLPIGDASTSAASAASAEATPKLPLQNSFGSVGEESSDPGSPLQLGRARHPAASGSPSPMPARADPGRRICAELEDALATAASKQAALTARWYSERSGSRIDVEPMRSAKSRNAEVEAAVESWVAGLPPGCRTLLVLVNGARFLAYRQPRELLRSLLRRHPGLHLLVTVTTSGNPVPVEPLSPNASIDAIEDAAASELEASPPPPLDSQVLEHPNLVPVPSLPVGEVAEVFFMAMMRTQQGRPLGQLLARMGRVQAVGRLSSHPAIVACQGSPGVAKELAEGLEPSVKTLEDLAALVGKKSGSGAS
eukprot:TRINITY_DN29055_c0_g1_i1.p1 TRINITY_DN29055_c0_g1~~TRINITY_DN29055_c0_g1_i1.p1  ORF type:complete len:1765 (-),score=333.44 TRINITY_DN29055_c0_g1_i1:71-5365(-)